MSSIIVRITVIVLSISAPLIVLTQRSVAQNSRGREPAATNPATEKTVDQVGKNIQVLNGLPQSQLYPVMRFMAASLGFQCGSCHVIGDRFGVFPADDKPEKQTARRMIKMVIDINRTLGEGNPSVSCYTCHRGTRTPAAAPTLPLRLAAPISVTPNTGPALPSVDEVLNKYITSIGGQTSINRIKSLVIKGTSTIFSGDIVAYEAELSVPDKGHESFAIQYLTGRNCDGDSRCEYARVVNGRQGWLKSGGGVQELAGQQLGDQRLSFLLFGILRLQDQYSDFRVVGRDKIDDQEVYVVSAVRSDNKPERLYFDLESGLLRRRIGYTRTPIGTIPQQVDFEDYRIVDGLRVPFTMTMSYVDAGSRPIVRRFTEIKFNAPIEDSKFEKP